VGYIVSLTPGEMCKRNTRKELYQKPIVSFGHLETRVRLARPMELSTFELAQIEEPLYGDRFER
jgi:hypothetical protein